MSPLPSVASPTSSSPVTALIGLAGRHAGSVETAAQLAGRTQAQRESGHGPVVAVDPVWASLLPARGLERGHVCACTGDAAVSAALSLVAHATQSGSWFAMVDMPRVGLVAAHEHGVALERTVCVDTDGVAQWAQVAGAVVDGIDIVAFASPRCSPADARRITARARAQGTVLVVVGNPGAFAPDVSLRAGTVSWEFDTHAAARTVHVQVSGRRVHTTRGAELLLPSRAGAVARA